MNVDSHIKNNILRHFKIP